MFDVLPDVSPYIWCIFRLSICSDVFPELLLCYLRYFQMLLYYSDVFTQFVSFTRCIIGCISLSDVFPEPFSCIWCIPRYALVSLRYFQNIFFSSYVFPKLLLLSDVFPYIPFVILMHFQNSMIFLSDEFWNMSLSFNVFPEPLSSYMMYFQIFPCNYDALSKFISFYSLMYYRMCLSL